MPRRGEQAICAHCGQEIHWVSDPISSRFLTRTPAWYHTTHFMKNCMDSQRLATPRVLVT